MSPPPVNRVPQAQQQREPKLTIHLDPPTGYGPLDPSGVTRQSERKPTFLPDSLVNGKILLTLPPLTSRMVKIRITFQGILISEMQKAVGMYGEPFLEHSTLLWSSSSLTTGVKELPFSLPIVDPSRPQVLPASYEARRTCVRYRMVAKLLDEDEKVLGVAQHKFRVRDGVDADSESLREPVSLRAPLLRPPFLASQSLVRLLPSSSSSSPSSTCPRSPSPSPSPFITTSSSVPSSVSSSSVFSPSFVTLSTPRTGYLPGDNLTLRIRLPDLGKRGVEGEEVAKVRVILKRKCVHNGPGYTEILRSIRKRRAFTMTSHATDLGMTLPRDLRPTDTRTKLVQLTYKLKVEVEMRGKKALLRLGLIIGSYGSHRGEEDPIQAPLPAYNDDIRLPEYPLLLPPPPIRGEDLGEATDDSGMDDEEAEEEEEEEEEEEKEYVEEERRGGAYPSDQPLACTSLSSIPPTTPLEESLHGVGFFQEGSPISQAPSPDLVSRSAPPTSSRVSPQARPMPHPEDAPLFSEALLQSILGSPPAYAK